MEQPFSWRVFKGVLMVLGAILFYFHLQDVVWSQETLFQTLIFSLFLFTLSTFTTVGRGSSTTGSITLPLVIPALYFLGPFWGGVVAALGSIQPGQLARDFPWSTFFANRALMYIAAGTSAFWLPFLSGEAFQWSEIWVLCMMALTFFLVNNFLLWLGIKSLGEKKDEEFLLFAMECGKSVVITTLISIIFIIVYEARGMPGIVLLFALIFLFRDTLQARFRLMNNFIQVIESFARILDTRDPYSAGHSERVARYAEDIARASKLSPMKIPRLVQAAKLHDVGKMGVPEAILQKPGPLSKVEFTSIYKHPALGEEILKDIEAMADILPIIRHHHERYDGTGYPDGLLGKDINIEARILALADAFDCMTTDRVYRQALGKERVLGELKNCSGTQFDPQLAELLHARVQAGVYDHCFQEDKLLEEDVQ